MADATYFPFMKQIPLKNRKREVVHHALVDDEDFEWLSQFAWHFKRGYASHSIKPGKSILMHRMIYEHRTGQIPPRLIDHIDRHKANNQFNNLRPATPVQNALNRDMNANNTTGFIGISHRPDTNRYEARCIFENSPISLGTFSTARDAAIARDIFVSERYPSEIATLNIPEVDKSDVDRIRKQMLSAKKRPGASCFIGVKRNGYKPSKSKWIAHVRKDGKLHVIGYFIEENEAALARDYYAIHMLEGCDLNFPNATPDDYRRIRDRILSRKRVKILPFYDKFA